MNVGLRSRTAIWAESVAGAVSAVRSLPSAVALTWALGLSLRGVRVGPLSELAGSAPCPWVSCPPLLSQLRSCAELHLVLSLVFRWQDLPATFLASLPFSQTGSHLYVTVL